MFVSWINVTPGSPLRTGGPHRQGGSSPKRLALLELLAQGEKTVDALAAEAGIDIKLASAHLKVLKAARLVEAQREGRFIAYRLSGEDVSALWVNLRTVAEEHLVELKMAMEQIFAAPGGSTPKHGVR